jgi:hypothetical protein
MAPPEVRVDSAQTTGGSLRVEWVKPSNNGGRSVLNYQLFRALAPGELSQQIIIDNEDGIIANGTWKYGDTTGAAPGEIYAKAGFNPTYIYSQPNTFVNPSTIRIEYEVEIDGYYTLFVRYPQVKNAQPDAHSAAVPIFIEHVNGVSLIHLNQQTKYSEWNNIGDFHCSNLAKCVFTMSTEGTVGYVVFDAIRVEQRTSKVLVGNKTAYLEYGLKVNSEYNFQVLANTFHDKNDNMLLRLRGKKDARRCVPSTLQ